MAFVRLYATASRTIRKMACRYIRQSVAFVVALAVVSGASCRTARTPQTDQRYVQQLEPLLEQFVQWQEIPGLVIGIVENNRLVYTHAFGVKHLRRPSDPLTTRSLFHMP